MNKESIINNLTSSKNERLCFGVIWDETIGKGKGNTIILPEAFEKVGVTDKKRRNEAINRLAEKGLIFRARCDAHYYPHICNRYSVIKSGCRRFLEESEVMCELFNNSLDLCCFGNCALLGGNIFSS